MPEASTVTIPFNLMWTRDPSAVRAAIREGAYRSHTAGLCTGYLQVNLVILPEAYALDFMRFCQRNPKPCPLVGVTETGDPLIRTLGADIDLRTDVPAYNIYRDGRLDISTSDITAHWSDDMVGFALGCSFTFEHALLRAGIPLWHVEHDTTVPMFRTDRACVPAGPFRAGMVVSQRNIDPARLDEVVEISRRFPLAHGAPIHVGDPSAIGITDIGRPDWGDPAPLRDGEIPVFWACGVTPQVALEAAAPPICITHKPGHMLITDVPDDAEIPVLAPA